MSLVAEWVAKIGGFVQIPLPEGKQMDRTAYGRICAVETYTDDICTRKWVYVRWINDAGKPDSELMKHAMEELEPFE